MNRPKYPVYIISKGRYEKSLTADFMVKDGLDFYIVVEPQEEEPYRAKFGDRVKVLPFANLGLGSFPARNWCWEDSIANGFKRHWIFDDNISYILHFDGVKRIRCNSNTALYISEQFTEQYTNIGLTGLNYLTFIIPQDTKKPFYLNTHVYSGMLIKNDMPYRWRLRYNEDTDLCLQILHNRKLCTVNLNTFGIDKMQTMVMKGGNTDELYKGDGRWKMAEMLRKMWPQYVETRFKFGRPQHHIKKNWAIFTHPLVKDLKLDWGNIQKAKINLVKLKEIKSSTLEKHFNKIKDLQNEN
jgi:hypothetical protein